MGGVVAFEMAQQLHRLGQDVALLALLDSRAPTTLNGATEIDDESLLLQFSSDISQLYGVEQSLPQESDAEPRAVEEYLRLLLQRIVNTNAAPPALDLGAARDGCEPAVLDEDRH